MRVSATARPTPLPAPVTNATFCTVAMFESSPLRPLVGEPSFYWLMLIPTSRARRSARQRAQPGASRRPRSALSRDPLGDGLRRRRPAEAKALKRMNTGRAQEQMLLGGLDALRRDFHAEPPPQADHRMHDRRGVGRALDIGDEAAIDLQAVEREGA